MTPLSKTQLTEDDFRNLPTLRDSLAAFLATDAGAWLIHLLRERNLPQRPAAALPSDKLEQLDAAARRESIGWENCIRHLILLSTPKPIPQEKERGARLGVIPPNDPYLPPERPITPRENA